MLYKNGHGAAGDSRTSFGGEWDGIERRCMTRMSPNPAETAAPSNLTMDAAAIARRAALSTTDGSAIEARRPSGPQSTHSNDLENEYAEMYAAEATADKLYAIIVEGATHTALAPSGASTVTRGVGVVSDPKHVSPTELALSGASTVTRGSGEVSVTAALGGTIQPMRGSLGGMELPAEFMAYADGPRHRQSRVDEV